MRRHEEDFERLPSLSLLTDRPDPTETIAQVAEASAASLPKGDELGRSYLERPNRHFALKEARSGKVEGVRVVLVWTDPNVSQVNTGGVHASAGSSSGDTYVFAELPDEVPWASIWFRPRGVPHDPATQPSSGNPAFDDAFLWAGDDASKTLPAPVMDCFLGAARGLFAWASFSGDRLCLHSVDSPDSDDSQAERMIAFA